MTKFWEQRYSLSPDCTPTPSLDDDWFENRELYTFLIDIDANELDDDAMDLLSDLQGFDCLRVADEDYLHITIKQIGFVVGYPTREEELSRKSSEVIEEKADRILSQFDPFTVELSGLDLFPSVVFCDVSSSREVKQIHHRLRSFPEVKEFKYDGFSFKPHMTLAEFCSESEYYELLGYLEENKSISLGEVEVDSIQLARTTSNDSMPDFEIVREFDLSN